MEQSKIIDMLETYHAANQVWDGAAIGVFGEDSPPLVYGIVQTGIDEIERHSSDLHKMNITL